MPKQTKFEVFCEQHPWLMGEKEWKRALAIYGYALLASLMVYGVIFGVMIVFTLVDVLVNG